MFTSVIPQFLTADASALDVAILGVVFGVLGLVSLVVRTLLGVASRHAIAFARVQEIVMRVSGAILVAFGLRLAFDR